MKMAIGSGKLIYDRKLLERAWDQAVLWLILAAFCVLWSDLGSGFGGSIWK